MQDHMGLFPLAGNLQFAKGVLLLDDADGTFQWTADGTGGDDIHAYSNEANWSGTNGIKLATRSTSAEDGDTVRIYRKTGWPLSGLLVMRGRVCIPDITKVNDLQFELHIADGVDYYEPMVKYHVKLGEAYYIDAAGAAVAIPGTGLGWTASQWHIMEMAVNLTDLKWVHAQFDHVKVDLGDVALYDGGADTDTEIWISIRLTNDTANQGVAYIDNVYVGEYLAV